MLAIFASHRHYAFGLPGCEGKVGEEAVVRDIMDATVPGLGDCWAESKDDVEKLGAGEEMRTFMWQHVVCETPGRIGEMLRGREGILPLSAEV